MAYLIQYDAISKSRDKSILKNIIHEQFICLFTRTSPFDDLDSQIRYELSKSVNSNTTDGKLIGKWNRLGVWQKFIVSARELCLIAKALLSLPSSEASVERSFNTRARIHNQSRNCLLPESIEAQVFLAFNSDKINNVTNTLNPNHYIELDDNFDPYDVEYDLDFLNPDIESEIINDNDTDSNLDSIPSVQSNIEPQQHSQSVLDQFISEYIIKYNIANDPKWKWNADRRNQLEIDQAQYVPPIRDTTDYIVELIKTRCLQSQN